MVAVAGGRLQLSVVSANRGDSEAGGDDDVLYF